MRPEVYYSLASNSCYVNLKHIIKINYDLHIQTIQVITVPSLFSSDPCHVYMQESRHTEFLHGL